MKWDADEVTGVSYVRRDRELRREFLWLSCRARKLFSLRIISVPLWRFFETDFDDLLRVGDVVPAAVGLPAIGNNLHESSTNRGVRDVSNAFAIGFHIELELLVFPDDVFFDVFDVDASVLNGDGVVAARDFDCQTGKLDAGL